MINSKLKDCYERFNKLGTQKYLLSNKELVNITCSFLAGLSLGSEIQEENLPSELILALQQIGQAHLAANCLGDFYSSPLHPQSLQRLGFLNN